MNTPNNFDPVAWAMFNARMAQNIAVVSWPEACVAAAKVIDADAEVELSPYEVTVLELPECFGELETAIHRAASELENQGEKSSRIALQLLTALAKFHAEMGR